MPEITNPDFVFARPRWQYQSYTDFWHLVELSGFQVVPFEEIDLSADRAYIFTPINGEAYAFERSPDRKCKLIWWMLERFDGGNQPRMHDQITHGLKYADEVWVSDRWIASLDSRLRFVPLGGHTGLNLGMAGTSRSYDYAHMSYAWGRRANLYAKLRSRGLREAPACWGAERHKVLSASRCLLNAQQYPGAVTAPLRMVLAAAYVMPVVTETITDPWPLVESDFRLMAPIEELPDLMVACSQEWPTTDGHTLSKKLLHDWPFHRGVEEAIREA